MTLSKVLNELASGSARSKIGRMRAVIDDVEAALAAGVYQYAVVEVLRESGLEMTPGFFRNTLFRIRREKARERNKERPGLREERAVNMPSLKDMGAKLLDPSSEKDMSGSPIRDPVRELEAIMRSTPDLDALAKIAKVNRDRDLRS
ncbi:hypothetical protein QN375_08945 [Pseudomonas sp. MH9.2]|uniref:hypothetical protein n=1 Tax=Pseudomonas sp. MH9.2 TaxID=3048629 RepID=UPI002AC97FDE|nr:hypothetical protein [Pseudomonas sp. MH9.2]MEB0025895.1 hypothetical protein [Pseudomonas sp. MH9.2]WPX71338.1 hypothetical protein RHM55_12700 [Pseudomonas sp. MH9.2]